MSLPIRTTVEDIQVVCGYFAKKPTGATVREAKAVLDPKRLDGRKLSALKFWGLMEGEGRLKLTSKGREAVTNDGVRQATVLADVIREIEPYRAIVERVAHRDEGSIASLDVAAHWHDYFADQVSSNERILNDQAVCFFQVAAGAGLGHLIIGRRGSPTRFDFEKAALKLFIDGKPLTYDSIKEAETGSEKERDDVPVEHKGLSSSQEQELGRGIFVAHGKNKKPLEQLKKILEQFRIPYKVAVEEPNLGRPIGEKVGEIMRTCNCAILIFTADEEFNDQAGNTVWRPSENIVYELGAASFLYGKRIVILKEDAVEFPTNFKDLGYISFGKDQLEAKSMDVLKELIGFGIVKVST